MVHKLRNLFSKLEKDAERMNRKDPIVNRFRRDILGEKEPLKPMN